MDFIEKIKQIFEKNEISLSDDNAKKFEIFYQKLIDWNSKMNLTAITDVDDVITKHFLDSVLPMDIFTPNARVLDIGCGAGLPSLPLKILRPDLNLILIDSVGKKLNFVDEIIDTFELKNIKSIHTRAEDLAVKNDFRESFDFVIFRAVASLPTLIEYGIPFLKVGGKLVAYKSQDVENELKICDNAFDKLSCSFEKILEYDLFGLTRNVVVINKIKKTDSKYPRKQNKPRTSPL